MTNEKLIVAFQGTEGAYMHMATQEMFPDCDIYPCQSFDDTFRCVPEGIANHAMIAIDNNTAGRVADVHLLLKDSGLYITGECFLNINHCLMSVEGASLETIRQVHSHVHALPQCRQFIQNHKLEGVVHADTAGAAADIAKLNDPTKAAIASELAAEIYGLNIIQKSIQDQKNNMTRFIVLSPEPITDTLSSDSKSQITAFIFEVRNIPAALYKALGGFATNGVNMLKLESYVDHGFNAAQFYCEVEGHPEDKELSFALEELSFFAKDVKILGSFPKSPLRETF